MPRSNRAIGAAGGLDKSARNADGSVIGASVLLVEDDPDDVRIIAQALEASSVPLTVHVEDDGAKALSYLEGLCDAAAATPDLILLDLNLPMMSGTEFLAALRSHRRLHGVPVCVLTTADDEATIRRAYAAGANAVVTKADSLAGMSAILNTIVEFWFKVAERYSTD